MLCKLSLKNIKKSIKDYVIYFCTLILGVAIFYVFNALDGQTVMLKVSTSTQELIQLMMTILSGVSVFVSFVLGFLIIYASRFLIKRRKKEFGIYLTLGMSKRKISIILFLETIIIGVLSLLVGLGLGVILSQLMSLLVANMFEANLTEFTFVFSSKAFVKTIIYFGIMYLIVMLFNTFSVSQCKLIDLLHGARKSEKIRLKNPILCVIVFVLAAVVLGIAYYMVTAGFTFLYEPKDFILIIVMGVVSTFFIFWSLSGLILRIIMSMKIIYYKGLNSFTLRQFSSKVNTSVFSITIICLLLFITICLLSSCLTMKNSMNKNIKKLTPADIMLTTAYMDNQYDYFKNHGYTDEQIANSHYTVLEKLDIIGIDIKKDLKDYIEVNDYATPDLTLNHTLGSKLEQIRTEFPYLSYDTQEPIMTISDYNKVARFYGMDEYTVEDDEYIIVADFKSMIEVRNIALENNEVITIFGHKLKPKYRTCQDGFLEMSSQHINTGIIVVSDEVAVADYLYNNYLIGNYHTSKKEEIRAIEEHINEVASSEQWENYLPLDGSSKLSIKEATVSLTAMVTFIGLYLGIIFLICCAAMLGLKELSESSDNKERFTMLRNIGVDEKLINKALFRQIGIFFMLPMLVALIHSVFGIMFAKKVLEIVGDDQLLPSIIMTAVFMVLIYGGYFLITYFCSKNILKEKR